MSDNSSQKSRRWLMKAGALSSGALALGLPGSVVAQQTETPTEDDDTAGFRPGLMFSDEFHPSAVFRVVSPPLQDAPVVENEDLLADHSVRVIEYFNTNDESYLFVPQGQQVQEGDIYVFDDRFAEVTANGDIDTDVRLGNDLTQVQYRPLGQEGFPFDLEEEDEFEIMEEGGGEAAIRPSDFYTGALFQITSGPQGWVPEDVADSGFFTDYNTVHAEFLGTNDEFLFFPQEDAETEMGRLYVMWEEFEFFEPEGNLVVTEYDIVNEESIDVDDDFL